MQLVQLQELFGFYLERTIPLHTQQDFQELKARLKASKYMYFPSALFLTNYSKLLSKLFKSAQEKKISNVISGVSKHWKARSFPVFAACSSYFFYSVLFFCISF